MKKTINKIRGLFILFSLSLFISGCTLFGLDVQKDYDYEKFVLDDHIHMSAWDYLKLRANGTPQNPNDTVFRWMKKAIDYSGIDTTEYMKPNRTYIFLHNEAIRRVNATQVLQNNCFFYDFPILRKNPDGSVISPTPADGAKKWEQYDKETVKKYLQYLIVEGDYNYNNLTNNVDTVKTLLPPGSVATKESRLGYVVGFELAGEPGASPILRIDYVGNTGKGFDPAGKADIRLRNDKDSRVYFNGFFVARTGGIYADNGAIHVFGTTVWPIRF